MITWSLRDAALSQILEAGPAAVMLSFGDPRPHAAAIKAARCKLMCQVQDLNGVALALEAGADVIVAQGTEAGGHGGSRATFPLVPAAVDAAGKTPVLAAGGVADGRGLAAALMLGAQGVLLGTRFYACAEALGHEQAKQRIAQGSGDDTCRTRVFDIVRGYDWPEGYTGRALRNRFMQRWHGDEAALAAAGGAQTPAFWAAASDGDYDVVMVWAGEAVDLIHNVNDASVVLGQLMAETHACLQRACRFLV